MHDPRTSVVSSRSKLAIGGTGTTCEEEDEVVAERWEESESGEGSCFSASIECK